MGFVQATMLVALGAVVARLTVGRQAGKRLLIRRPADQRAPEDLVARGFQELVTRIRPERQDERQRKKPQHLHERPSSRA